MAKEKLLLLAFDMANAPSFLKEKALAHKANVQKVNKAEAQLRLWTAELQKARAASNETMSALDKELDAWNPSNTTTKVEL